MTGNAARRERGAFDRLSRNLVRVSEAGLLAGDCSHAHAAIRAERALLHDAVLESPRFAANRLKEKLTHVEVVAHQCAEHTFAVGHVEPAAREQYVFRAVHFAHSGPLVRVLCGHP